MSPQEFFDAMRFFGEPEIPENTDFSTILGAYIRGLRHYSGDVLASAANRILTTRNYRNFPLPAECINACEEFQIIERRKAENNKDKGTDPWSDFRVNQANRMMNSDIGRLAAKEGWIIHLHDFCRENSRLPGNFESDKVRAQGLRNKAEREEMARKAGIQNPLVKSIARAMDSKRMRLATIAGRDV